MASSLKVLVVGATGKQGGAVVNALLASPLANSLTIFASTRDVESASAKRLTSKSKNIRPIKGQMEDSPSLFKSIGDKVDTVYCVTVPNMGSSNQDIEERQGKSLIDASVANGVKHFVFSSVDRHGSKSDTNPTPVPHFISKHNIEVYLKEQCAKSGMKYTILRPVFFMDNIEPSFVGKITATCWAAMPKNSKLQMVAVKDIGVFAAKAITSPKEYENRAISIAGDEMTFGEANEKFKALYGKDIPRTFGVLGWGMKAAVKELGTMFKWFEEEGYGANVKECRKVHPDISGFGEFLRAEGQFEK